MLPVQDVRQRLLERARALGVDGDSEERLIDALLDREVQVPPPDEQECRRYYAEHPDLFRSGDLVEADHILFAVTEQVPLAARRRRGEADAQRVRNAVARTRATTVSMGVTTEILARAGRSFPKEPIRTLDAIHLATVLAFTTVFPDLTVLSLDRRVLDNAEALGLYDPRRGAVLPTLTPLACSTSLPPGSAT